MSVWVEQTPQYREAPTGPGRGWRIRDVVLGRSRRNGDRYSRDADPERETHDRLINFARMRDPDVAVEDPLVEVTVTARTMSGRVVTIRTDCADFLAVDFDTDDDRTFGRPPHTAGLTGGTIRVEMRPPRVDGGSMCEVSINDDERDHDGDA